MRSTGKGQKKETRLFTKIFARHALRRCACFLVRATERCEAAAKEVLYDLPGVFAMSLVAAGEEVRLIKEADCFRIMKKAERSDVLLSIRFEDLAILGDLTARECTMQKALAERRLTCFGKIGYLATVMRVSAEGDKALLGEGAYEELYGKGE